MLITLKKTIDDCNINEYVPVAIVKDWPPLSAESSTAFRKFTGLRQDGYNLVRKGNKIFSLGTDVAKCVYNYTRQF